MLPYHQLMTPTWLHTNAIINGPHGLFQEYFEVISAPQQPLHRALRVQLVPPGILAATSHVTITLTIAMDTILANSRDHDPIIGVGDGASFNGFRVLDRENYPTESPCPFFEGDSSRGRIDNQRSGTAPLVASRRYSGEVKIQIRPTEQWGSCTTEHDEGYTSVGIYQHSIDITKGLFFEFYRGDDVIEMYRIKYVVAEVNLD